jgi:hypothetical protein
VASRKLIAGVELHSQGARIALLTLKPVPTVVHCEEIATQPGDETRLGPLIAKALYRYGAKRADVNLVFTPPQPAPSRHQLFTAPKLRSSELVQVAVRELKRDGTIDPANSYFCVETLETAETESGAKGKRYLLVGLAREVLDVVATSLLASKLVVRSATTSPMGILRVAALQDLPKKGCVAVCQLDPKRSMLMVLDNGIPQFFREIPTTFARGGREGADDTLIAQALAREIDISLVFFAQQFRPKHVDHIMVVGDAEIADRVTEWLEDNESYTLVRFEANQKLTQLPNTPPNLLPFAAAIGAALARQKGAIDVDVLPSQLRGRPERVWSLAVGAVTLVVLMVAVMGARKHVVDISSEDEARLLAARNNYMDLERRIAAARNIDDSVGHAEKWEGFFEGVQLYHRRLGNFLAQLSNASPQKGAFREVKMEPAPFPRPPPPKGKADANLKVAIAGAVVAPDLSSAQSEVLHTYRALETIRDVQTATLSPLTNQSNNAQGTRLPFEVKLDLSCPLPGVKK